MTRGWIGVEARKSRRNWPIVPVERRQRAPDRRRPARQSADAPASPGDICSPVDKKPVKDLRHARLIAALKPGEPAYRSVTARQKGEFSTTIKIGKRPPLTRERDELIHLQIVFRTRAATGISGNAPIEPVGGFERRAC